MSPVLTCYFSFTDTSNKVMSGVRTKICKMVTKKHSKHHRVHRLHNTCKFNNYSYKLTASNWIWLNINKHYRCINTFCNETLQLYFRVNNKNVSRYTRGWLLNNIWIAIDRLLTKGKVMNFIMNVTRTIMTILVMKDQLSS